MVNFKLLLLAWLLIPPPAWAGGFSDWWSAWWPDFCEKHIAQADPYQFEHAPDWYIHRELDRLDAELIWKGKLSASDQSTLNLLRREFKFRAMAASQALGEPKDGLD